MEKPATAQEERKYTEAEAMELEIAAINILQEVGVSFRVPLHSEDKPKKAHKRANDKPALHFLKRMFKSAHKPLFEVVQTQIPNPSNPAETIDQYLADIRIKPLFLSTIDIIRAKMLAMSLQEPSLEDKLGADSGELLKYSKDMCEVVAIATLNTGKIHKHRHEIAELTEFYHTHLNSTRLFKLVKVIVAMMDTASFRGSIRLAKEMGTTAPSKADRIEKTETSKA